MTAGLINERLLVIHFCTKLKEYKLSLLIDHTDYIKHSEKQTDLPFFLYSWAVV